MAADRPPRADTTGVWSEMLQQPAEAAERSFPTAERTVPPVRVPRQRQSYARPGAAVRGSRARRAMLLPIVLCGVALLAGAAALGAVAVASAQHTSHTFRLPDRTGTLVREADTSGEVSRRLAVAEDGFRKRFGSRLDSVVSAAYRNDSPAAGRPAGSVLLVGAGIDTHGDPDDFVSAFEAAARRAGYGVETVSAGPGARGACLSAGSGAVTCAWSTGDSVGEVIPTGTGWSVAGLAEELRTLRSAAEVRSRR